MRQQEVLPSESTAMSSPQEIPWSLIASGIAAVFTAILGAMRWLAVGRIDDLKGQIEFLRGECKDLRDSHIECERRSADLSRRVETLEQR